ncbi:MAG: fluoride efflux transporter CrcB [Sedimentitalea sp.]
MMSAVLLVGLGGALGAMARFSLGIAVLRALGPTALPVPILVINVLGSLAMGFCVVALAQKGLSHLGLFVLTGLLGGFTTFSAFSLETVTLLESGATGQAALYVALSVGLSVGGLMVGLWLARGIWA